MYGDIDDYYKPILAEYSFRERDDKKSFEIGHEWYACRGTKDNNEYLNTYIDNVTSHLKRLIKEKQVRDLKIQVIVGIRLFDPIRKKGFTYYVNLIYLYLFTYSSY